MFVYFIQTHNVTLLGWSLLFFAFWYFNFPPIVKLFKLHYQVYSQLIKVLVQLHVNIISYLPFFLLNHVQTGMISWISTFASDLAYYFIANFVKIPKDTHILAFRFNSSLKLLIFYIFFCYCNKGRVSFNRRPNFICSYFLSATQNCLLKPCYFMPANFIDQLFYDLSCFLVSGLNHYLLRLPFPNIILKLLVRITSSRVLM